jgi:hypothetical protein
MNRPRSIKRRKQFRRTPQKAVMVAGASGTGAAGSVAGTPSMGVEAKGTVAGEAPPPPRPQPGPETLAWQGPDQTSEQIRDMYEERRRRNVAATALAETVEPPPFMAGADRSSTPLPLKNETAAPGGLSVSATASTDPQSALNKHDPAVAMIERRLSERTSEWRDVARALSTAVRDQISELQRHKPNEEDQLPAFNDLIAFLETLEKKLAALADALDQATKEAGVEPMFLGKAAVIARQLDLGLIGFLEKHRVRIFEVGFSLSALGAVSYFCGGLSGDPVEVLKVILGLDRR